MQISSPPPGLSTGARLVMAGLLVALIVACRLCIDTPNFQPVMSVALFAGFLFASRWTGLCVVVSAMFLSDCLIGTFQWQLMVVVYLALAAPVLAGFRIRQMNNQPVATVFWLGGSTIGAALLFYLATNFAVWGFSGWYPASFSGLVECMAMGLAFFKWTLASNMVFGGILFGVYGLVFCRLPRTRPCPAVVRVESRVG